MSVKDDRTYLDWNASAPLRRGARDAMMAVLEAAGNPSAVHAEGRRVRGIVEHARAQVAELVGCNPAEVVFTSGATEAASVLRHLPPEHSVCVHAFAHDCLWTHHDMASAHAAPDGPGHVLAMSHSNSEAGVITEPPVPVDGFWLVDDVRCDRLLLDIAQSAGKVDFDFRASGADLAILSAHKLGGPKGVGALIVREGMEIEPLLCGGGQELGRRSGTENVVGIAGFGAAALEASLDLEAGRWAEVEALRDELENALEACAEETIFVGRDSRRLPNTSCFVTPGWKGETQVMQMDLAGFAVSSGSACSSGKVKGSRVLRAMGLDAQSARCALRVSIGPTTTEEEVMRFVDAWTKHEEKLRQRAA